MTYILDMVAFVKYNFVLLEDLPELLTGHLHDGHGSDARITICIDGRHM